MLCSFYLSFVVLRSHSAVALFSFVYRAEALRASGTRDSCELVVGSGFCSCLLVEPLIAVAHCQASKQVSKHAYLQR